MWQEPAGAPDAVASTLAYLDTPSVSFPHRYLPDDSRRCLIVRELTGTWIKIDQRDGLRHSRFHSSQPHRGMLRLLETGKHSDWRTRRRDLDLWFSDESLTAEDANREVWIHLAVWLVHWRVAKHRSDARSRSRVRPSLANDDLGGSNLNAGGVTADGVDADLDGLQLVGGAEAAQDEVFDHLPATSPGQLERVVDVIAAAAEITLDVVSSGAYVPGSHTPLRWIDDGTGGLLRVSRRPTDLKRAGVEAVLRQIVLSNSRGSLIDRVLVRFNAGIDKKRNWLDRLVREISRVELARIEQWTRADYKQADRIATATEFALAQVIVARLHDVDGEEAVVLTFVLRALARSLPISLDTIRGDE